MPRREYALLFDEAVYADMVQYHYDPSRWMGMQRVGAKAIQISRSKKKLEELCRKGVILIGDTLTMRKTGRDGIAIAFSATIESFDQHSLPVMKTAGEMHGQTWPCAGPNSFDEAMVRAQPNLERSSRNTWDSIFVVRNHQVLGTLHLFRQCLQLWEDELEKWGCNGLGEELGVTNGTSLTVIRNVHSKGSDPSGPRALDGRL